MGLEVLSFCKSYFAGEPFNYDKPFIVTKNKITDNKNCSPKNHLQPEMA